MNAIIEITSVLFKIAICKNLQDKDGFYGDSKNNKNLDNYNAALENVATELSGVFDIDVVFLINILEAKDISKNGLHTTVSRGMSKHVRKFRNFNVHHVLTVSKTEITQGIINQNFGKNFYHYDNNIFLISIQNKKFYLKIIINSADGLFKYRTMRLFLIFSNFQYTYGKRKSC